MISFKFDFDICSVFSNQFLNPGTGDRVENAFIVGNSSLNFFTANLISEFPSSIPCKPVWVEVME